MHDSNYGYSGGRRQIFMYTGSVGSSTYWQLDGLQIWQMKQEEVHAVAHKLLAADRVIHEQQLGWQWQGPDEDALLAAPNSPKAMHALTGSKKKSATHKTSSEIGDNEEMPGGMLSGFPSCCKM